MNQVTCVIPRTQPTQKQNEIRKGNKIWTALNRNW